MMLESVPKPLKAPYPPSSPLEPEPPFHRGPMNPEPPEPFPLAMAVETAAVGYCCLKKGARKDGTDGLLVGPDMTAHVCFCGGSARVSGRRGVPGRAKPRLEKLER